jgi:hypothetical protein
VGRGLGRPPATPAALRLAALGFLVLAAGLFVVPHGASLGELLAGLPGAPAATRGRALSGGAMIAAGLAAGVLGWAAAARRTAAEGRPGPGAGGAP